MSDQLAAVKPTGWTYYDSEKPWEQTPAASSPQASEPGALLAVAGHSWQSKPVPAKEFEYYGIDFESRADAQAYWWILFRDAQGELLAADHCSAFDPSANWTGQSFCFRASARACGMDVRFRPLNGEIEVRNVSVQQVTRPQVADWADAHLATMPPFQYTAPAGRWDRLGQLRAKLQRGGDVRILILGDSVANDCAVSPADVLIERHWPGATVRMTASVYGGGNCKFYRQEGNVQKFVLDYDPDLVMIGGISHGGNVENIQDVVRQARAARPSIDFVVATGAPAPMRAEGPPPEWNGFPDRLKAMADEEKIAFVDLETPFESYVVQTGKGKQWFMRDSHHANARARQILARLLEGFFKP